LAAVTHLSPTCHPAFQVLRRLSEKTNTKLADMAELVVTQEAGDRDFSGGPG